VPASVREIIRWSANELPADDRSRMAAWPKTLRVHVNGVGDVLFCHGTPRHENEIFTRLTPEDRLLPIIEAAHAPVVVCGHTHMPFDRQVGRTRVVNAGSVGMPFCAAGAYWLLLGPGVGLRRTTYDLTAAAERVRATPYPQAQEFADTYVLNPPSEASMVEAFEKVALKNVKWTIAALGDSTTAGTPGFSSPIEAPPDGAGDVESQYAYWLMRAHPEWRVLNLGAKGQRSDEIRARFERDVVAAAPHVVIILAGANDIYEGYGAERIERELEVMYRAAAAAHITVVTATIIPYDTATAEQSAQMHAVNAWIREYAAAHPRETAFCDTRAAVAAPDCADRLVSSPDGLHPSPDGYRRMARALEPAVIRAILGG
jgi:lysophospholipase L1-like esterase